MSDLVNSFIEVELPNKDSFLKIKETLTRIGICSYVDKSLYQSCHILHKRGKYYIVHFKELFALDGRDTDISEEDIRRRNAIVQLLEEWKLLKSITSIEKVKDLGGIKILPYSKKNDWKLVPKYKIGKK